MSKRDDQPFGDADASADDNVSITQWVRDLTYREIHLSIEGFYDGYVDERDANYEKTVQGRVTGDSWYYKAAFVVGNTLDRVLTAVRLK